jgi:DNA-binding transcriptional LysR family regulator
VDTRLLRTFHAVVEHGSFTAAASALGYTQSAVSQHVAALETSLGVELFRRRPFGLTPAAVRLAEHAGSILQRLDVAASELRAADRRQPVRISASPFAAAHPRVAALMTAAGATQRGGRLTISSTEAAVDAVARGHADAGAIDGIVSAADPLAASDPGLLTSVVVHVGPLGVVLPADHPLALRTSLAWTAVADARWLDAPEIAPRAAPGAAELLRRRSGTTTFSGHDGAALASLVAAGHGLALVPMWWLPGHTVPTAAGVVTIALRDPPLVHRIELVMLRSRSTEWSQHLATSEA